mmetsp:Transcript_9268/g.20209  ORF Transcript_9268/g.20209 Transcript_9268/m.20209 type:complete len:322 (-) Transcript_9268:83-1048(-)
MPSNHSCSRALRCRCSLSSCLRRWRSRQAPVLPRAAREQKPSQEAPNSTQTAPPRGHERRRRRAAMAKATSRATSSSRRWPMVAILTATATTFRARRAHRSCSLARQGSTNLKLEQRRRTSSPGAETAWDSDSAKRLQSATPVVDLRVVARVVADAAQLAVAVEVVMAAALVPRVEDQLRPGAADQASLWAMRRTAGRVGITRRPKARKGSCIHRGQPSVAHTHQYSLFRARKSHLTDLGIPARLRWARLRWERRGRSVYSSRQVLSTRTMHSRGMVALARPERHRIYRFGSHSKEKEALQCHACHLTPMRYGMHVIESYH